MSSALRNIDEGYIDGYVPSSFDAPHSSLHRTITWVAMGCILSSLAGLGMMTFGLATMVAGNRADATGFAIGGAALGFGFLFLGFFLVHVGRKNYRAYHARTGRIH